jgi:hypothetical protein
MKYWEKQIRIADLAWLYNPHQQRSFVVTAKNFTGTDKTFRIESYSILEVHAKAPTIVPYETMEELITNKTLIII